MESIGTSNSNASKVELLEERVLFSTYYLSPDGDDGDSGTSASSAWRSLNRAGQATFQAGDRLLLEGGATFRGQLYIGPDEHGTSDNPFTIASYGTGHATINAGANSGIFVYNTAGLNIQNLRIVGSGTKTNHGDGIRLYNNLDNDVLLNHVDITNVEASNFGGVGISIGGWNGDSGFNDVSVTNSKLHDNARAGLMSYAPDKNVHKNIYVSQVLAYNNTGIANSEVNTGSGIVLGGVDGATIEYSVAHDNSRLGNGAVGIWAYDSNNVTIQHNESYRNQTAGTDDGDGFDLDRNVTNSVMQYNYSHENDGSGFGLYQNGPAGNYYNNTVRYNISQNDGHQNGYGGIDMWGPVQNCSIYNNTVYASASSAHPAAMRVISSVSNVRVYHNIFQATGGAYVLNLLSSAGLTFQNNDYWTGGASFQIHDASSTFFGLGAWRAGASQERIGNTSSGMSVDPHLANAGHGQTLGNALNLNQLSAYRLSLISPLMASANSATDSDEHDFYGIPHTGVSLIGAIGAESAPQARHIRPKLPKLIRKAA